MASGSGAGHDVSLALEGRVTAWTAAPIWGSAIETLTRNPDRPVVVDASRLEYVDDVGIALLFDLVRRDRPANAKVEIRELVSNLAALVRGYDPKDLAVPFRSRQHMGIFEHLGRATAYEIGLLMFGWSTGFYWDFLRRALSPRHRGRR